MGANRGVRVTFNLRGDDLEPSEVTRALAIEPTQKHRKGADRSELRFKGTYPHGLWSLESALPQSEALDAHLVWILGKLEPKRGAIQEILQRGYTAELRIGIFSDCEQVGVGISADLVERIADLGASLELDGYTLPASVDPPDLCGESAALRRD